MDASNSGRQSGTRFSLEVQPTVPQALGRLEDLASNLIFSWDRDVRSLFAHLDRDLWSACGHNPKLFLRRVSQEKLNEAATNRVYLSDYHGALADYDSYLAREVDPELRKCLDPARDLVAYFCAEFGLHESLPIYSGGLGILAGDHCKAASDLGLPFVAVGLLYRVGYFDQSIDAQGNQQLRLSLLEFLDLPVSRVLDAHGQPLAVQLELRDRLVQIAVWQVLVGHVRIYLLDTDLDSNHPEDRQITRQLYGGDHHTRIQQELVLGIGGVRALRAVGLVPTVWHINEGHAAFMVLERCRELIAEGLEFAAALERVASATVFTTHTPVPAGHDVFDRDVMRQYFGGFISQLGVQEEEFLRLGASPINSRGFNQTALALRGSRFHNGVSEIHRRVASRMEGYIWPEVPCAENPIDYIPNGIHVPTFLAAAWLHFFDLRLGRRWRNELLNESFWECIDALPDSAFWSVRQLLKFDLIKEVKQRLKVQLLRNGYSESHIKRLTRFLSTESDALIIGFARRFATYKRATLLFADPERLARLLGNPDRPVIIIFAGKAHPHDGHGQDLIRAVHRLSQQPEFEGRVVLLEGYDLTLARRLVAGVDVWLNTPQYPLEASGTSGMKAGINGVVHLSILDGWWNEGYRGDNGWAIAPHGDTVAGRKDEHSEAQELLEILEHEVIPLYFERNRQGYSRGWVRKAKSSMKSLIPRYSAHRMLMDYVRKFYQAAARQQVRFSEGNSSAAIALARWKKHVAHCWPQVGLRLLGDPDTKIKAGESLRLRVAASLGGLSVTDVMVECVIGTDSAHGGFRDTHRFSVGDTTSEGEAVFTLELEPSLSGLQEYKLRMYPRHDLLTHRFETGLMVWI